MRINRCLVLAAIAAAGIAAMVARAAPAPAPSPTFESHWQDGKAELDGYRYSVTRYGQLRSGTAVMVFVTEPFSESKRVKVDNPAANPQDTFEALKLNFIRDFQTGIYDYNTMTSLFVRSRDFSPAKISFSSAEWCSHVYEEMLFGAGDIADRYTSYFEDESRQSRLNRMVTGNAAKGLTEEELLVLLRSLRAEWLKPGEKRTVPFLASAFYRRLTHSPLEWKDAVIERSRVTEPVRVPAGAFETSVYTVSVLGTRDGKFWIERAYPHRIIRWEWRPAARRMGSHGGHWSLGEALDTGELTGSTRLPYWRLHNLGDEKLLSQLGLTAGTGGATAPIGGPKAGERR